MSYLWIGVSLSHWVNQPHEHPTMGRTVYNMDDKTVRSAEGKLAFWVIYMPSAALSNDGLVSRSDSDHASQTHNISPTLNVSVYVFYTLNFKTKSTWKTNDLGCIHATEIKQQRKAVTMQRQMLNWFFERGIKKNVYLSASMKIEWKYVIFSSKGSFWYYQTNK